MKLEETDPWLTKGFCLMPGDRMVSIPALLRRQETSLDAPTWLRVGHFRHNRSVLTKQLAALSSD